ncbi:hypothetical protein HCN44_009186 [Aphidius gifuensis]|uniref:Structure-specific endonuclease subunit SLX4 n=1 Tax=Aphidius gifuensis TaxID=684658 RepID=A0A835CXU7_APHGI|nr:uncharacterized protein LOC122857909 [Aphidius gifuensis]KAF7997788.1 hypothetical protein HCN44_009186 [Aphidius gifuensis]
MSKTTETNENSEILNSKPQSSKTNQESENNKKLIRSLSPDVDDSLADFKSPNIILKVPPKIINVKKKPGPRSKKKTTTTAPKESTSQPSIESQFFKQQNQFVCPLCFKTFNDAETLSSHAKTCAVKNKVSTRKLLAATELQERQAAERLHIGLPAGPVRTVKKKKPNIKNFMPEGDPDIQLAKALSISLQEMEQIEELDNAVAMVAEPDDKFIEMSSSLRRSTLQSFGFKTNKPQAELPQDKIKRRKNFGPTILETRTQETREALLTEKIAEIIVGVEQSTQARYVESNHQPTVHKKIKINSKLLKKYHKSDQKLWNYSKELLKNSEYYVNELAEYIQPLESKEQEITDINYEENNTNVAIDNFDDNRMDIDEATEAEDSHHQEIKTTKVKDNSQSNLSNIEENSSTENKLTSQKENENNDQIKSDKEKKDYNDDGDADDENDGESDSLKNNFMNNQSDKESSVVVAYDWYKMVGSTYGSDIKILLKHDKYIPAHSLVFLARCCNILNDIVDFNKPYDHWKKIIKWPTIDITAATYFLEYLYCGRIIKCCISNENNSIDQLKLLAHKYSVKKLFEYIIKKEKSSCKYHGKLKQDDKKNKTINKISDKAEIKINNNSDESADVDTKDKIAKDEYQIIDDIVWTDDFELEQNQDVQYKTPLSRLDLDKKQLTCSPDLFEDSVVYESDATSSVIHQESTKKFDESSTIINEITTPKLIDETQNVIPDESSTHEILETPLQSKSFTCRRKLSEVYPTKSKSDMTLYIEKIKRITARDINDTDTDGDTPVRPLKPPHKNPFKVKKNEDESFLLVGKKSYDDDDTLNADKSFTKKIKKSAISMIEDKLLADAGERLEKVQASNENNIDIGELSTEVESNCDDDEDEDNLEESMYTKYQKKTLSNSITNYRNDAIKFLENTAEMTTPPSESNSLKKSRNNTFNKSGIPETTINLTELSDSEPEKSQDIQHHSDIPNDHPGMEVDKVYSPDNKSFQSFQEPSKTSESLTDMHTINDVVFDSWSDALPLTQSNFKNSPDRNILTQQNSDSNSSHDTLKLNNDSDTEPNYCFTQKLSLSQEVADVFKDLSQKTNTDTNLNAHGLSQSPITLSSSSETSNLDDLDRFDEILKDLPEANKENNFSKSGNPEGGFEISNLLDSPIFSNSKNQTDESTTKLIPSTSKNITFRSSRVIKKHTSCISHTLSDNSDDEIPIASSTRCHSSLASPIVTNTSSRLLAVKSKSDGNFTKKLLHKKRESSVLKNNNLSRLTEVITPPLDYANMTSPEIYRELHKYGLKKQKRPKAIKLLTNIYDQLHPFVSDDDIPDTSTDNYNDDEPPRKKQCVQNEINCPDDNDDLSQESSSSSSSIVPEEMDLDEDDGGPSTISQGTLPIKELFVKYINKNKDVKRDILMYTPVPLEDLYRKLKAEGFNGKLNDFIDFLDSESITFQVKEAKRNDKKKTTKKKKCM